MTTKRLTEDQLNQIIRPVGQAIRSFHCGLDYLETFLESCAEEVPHGFDLNPDFQRGHVWTERQQVYFLECFLRGLVGEEGMTIRLNCPSWRTSPARDSDLLDQVVCIDGLQRLTAIREFLVGNLEPFGLHVSQFTGCYLPRRMRGCIVIKFYDFQYRKDLLTHYLDINGGGTQHTPDELERVRKLLEEAV
jgi:hypothetical protein